MILKNHCFNGDFIQFLKQFQVHPIFKFCVQHMQGKKIFKYMYNCIQNVLFDLLKEVIFMKKKTIILLHLLFTVYRFRL